MSDKIYVLTFEVNEYDQYGEYFITAFKNKPTFQELLPWVEENGYYPSDGISVEHATGELIRNGGGRHKCEHRWLFLNEVELS